MIKDINDGFEAFLNSVKDKAKNLLTQIKKIDKNGKQEDPTRRCIIDPMIRLLGYNIENFDEVRTEFHVRVKTSTEKVLGDVDYAICINESQKPVIFIEAKSIFENDLDKHISQLQTYVTNSDGIVRCAITNGYEWRIYNVDNLKLKELVKVNLDELSQNDGKIKELYISFSKNCVASDEIDPVAIIKEKEERDSINKVVHDLLNCQSDRMKEIISNSLLKEYILPNSNIKIPQGNGNVVNAKYDDYRKIVFDAISNEIDALNVNYLARIDSARIGGKVPPSPNPISSFVFENISEYNSGNKLLYYTVVEQKIAHKILSILKQSDVSSADLDKYCIDKYSYKDVLEDGILVKHCNANSGCLVSYIICDKVQEDIVAGQIHDWAIRYGNTTNLKESDEPAERDAMNGAIAFNISDKSEFEIIKGLLGDLGKFLSDKQNQGVGMNSSNNARCWISLKDIPLDDDDASDLESVEEDYLRKIDRLRDAIVYCYKHQIDLLKSKKS